MTSGGMGKCGIRFLVIAHNKRERGKRPYQILCDADAFVALWSFCFGRGTAGTHVVVVRLVGEVVGERRGAVAKLGEGLGKELEPEASAYVSALVAVDEIERVAQVGVAEAGLYLLPHAPYHAVLDEIVDTFGHDVVVGRAHDALAAARQYALHEGEPPAYALLYPAAVGSSYPSYWVGGGRLVVYAVANIFVGLDVCPDIFGQLARYACLHGQTDVVGVGVACQHLHEIAVVSCQLPSVARLGKHHERVEHERGCRLHFLPVVAASAVVGIVAKVVEHIVPKSVGYSLGSVGLAEHAVEADEAVYEYLLGREVQPFHVGLSALVGLLYGYVDGVVAQLLAQQLPVLIRQ